MDGPHGHVSDVVLLFPLVTGGGRDAVSMGLSHEDA